MSLRIDVDKVDRVLLPVIGWVSVKKGTFELDSYEFIDGSDDDYLLLGGGREPLIPATGFGFTGTDGSWYAGPLTSVLAVTCDGGES